MNSTSPALHVEILLDYSRALSAIRHEVIERSGADFMPAYICDALERVRELAELYGRTPLCPYLIGATQRAANDSLSPAART